MKTPIIYILSNGRSGSTILDLMLGSFPSLWTLGEAHLYQFEMERNSLIGSGEPIRESSFWKDIHAEINPMGQHCSIGHFRKAPENESVTGYVIRKNILRKIAMKGKCYNDPLVEEYGQLNAHYFSTVQQHAEKKFGNKINYLIDASKDPYRLLWLKLSGLFDIKVIHLTKDPRAFVYSTSRKNDKISFIKIIRMTGRWIIENFIMYKVYSKFFDRKDVYHLKYEDLATNPKATLSNIGRYFNVDLSNYSEDQFRNYTNFAISGNKSRWENKSITFDQKWKKGLPKLYRSLIKLSTSSFTRQYGYR